MVARCTYPSQSQYKNYGGRGIRVCDEWKNDFVAFFDWATKNGWQPGLTIDRKDVNGNYEPSNCRWATIRQQNYNRRNNRLLTAFGETKNATQWLADDRCKARSINCILNRLSLGWNDERAISTPTRKLNRLWR